MPGGASRHPPAAGHGSAAAWSEAKQPRAPIGGGTPWARRRLGRMAAMSNLVDPILQWYAAHARDLPWRRPTASAWSVLVSELMLQQTPVARVLPVHEAWLER